MSTGLEYTSNLDLKINNSAIPMASHAKVLGLTLDRYSHTAHTFITSQYTHNASTNNKTLTATGWGKQKETLMATYKAVMRPALEYASSIWSPLASSTSINKLQVMQNAELRTATGFKQYTNIQHLHDETFTHPIHEHPPRLTIQTENTPSITSLTQTYNILQHSKAKKHCLRQRPFHNKHSHRPPQSHYNRQKNKHAPYTYIYCF